MFGITTDDQEAVRTFQRILDAVALEWKLRGFKGDFLAIGVLEKDGTQVEVNLQMVGESGHVQSGRAILEWARGDSQKEEWVRSQILRAIRGAA